MSHGIATKSWKMIDFVFAHFEGLKNLARGRALLARVRVFWQRARKCVAVQFAALLVRLERQRRKRAGQLVAVEPQCGEWALRELFWTDVSPFLSFFRGSSQVLLLAAIA